MLIGGPLAGASILELAWRGVAWERAMAPADDPRLFDMEKVEAGKKAGKSIADLQNTITLASLRSMQSNAYGKYLSKNEYKYFPSFGPAATLQDGVNTNVAEVYHTLEKT